ncbi:MAG: hypothetical protein ABIA04_03085 [Pseudomonadota bacterium]
MFKFKKEKPIKNNKLKDKLPYLYLGVILMILLGSFGAVGPQGCGGTEDDEQFMQQSEVEDMEIEMQNDWVLREVPDEEDEEYQKEENQKQDIQEQYVEPDPFQQYEQFYQENEELLEV